ncbi:Myosin motor domain-containing protein [Plasmodiophora brassicae]
MAWVCAVRERAVARVVRDYFEETALAESSRLLELRAVTRMQAWWRGTLARGQLRLLNNSARRIQAAYRGYRGRQRAADQRRSHVRSLRRALYNEAATLIQKMYRGYMSRRTRVNFYARKRYIDEVAERSQALRRAMQAEFEQRKEEAREREQLEAAAEFSGITSNLHHLLSTATQAGIFKSPFGEVYSAKAFDIPVEEHIADAFRVGPVLRQ